jgi:hypothetical protein
VTIALVTSIYGDYDTLTDPPEQEGVTDYVAVVDHLQSGACSLWRQVVEPRPHMHPRLAAKVAKCCPGLYTDAEFTVWVDGSARLKNPRVAKWAVDQLGTEHAAHFAHPDRDDIYPEAIVSMGMGKYTGQLLMEQVDHYRQLGLPTSSGLWATGFIARPAWSGNNVAWLTEQTRWTYQDQISLPFVYWQQAGWPIILEGNLWGNDHVYFDGHAHGA